VPDDLTGRSSVPDDASPARADAPGALAGREKPHPHVTLGPGGEFDIIRRLVERWGDAAVGLGDDCAVMDMPPGTRLVATTDSSVDRVHFRADWITPEEIGWRATAAAVSDLAAAAAEPLGIMLALTLPDEWLGRVDALADGVGALAREAGIPIVGGDLTRGPVLALSITALGSARRPLGRSGARPGDGVVVTGLLGGSTMAVRTWLAGDTPGDALRSRFARPVPRLPEARWLAQRGARAAVDISDGLASDLDHMAHASSVRIVMDAERTPVLDGLDWQTAISSGEEYEVAMALPRDVDLPTLTREFQETFGLPLTHVATVEEGGIGLELRAGGARVDLPRGYDHFSG
jgi:thiamine-monophosphate kinase